MPEDIAVGTADTVTAPSLQGNRTRVKKVQGWAFRESWRRWSLTSKTKKVALVRAQAYQRQQLAINKRHRAAKL